MSNFVMDDRLAYAIGLFQSDGCLGINRKHKYLSDGTKRQYEYWFCHFGSTDEYLVEEFKITLKIRSSTLLSVDKRKKSYKKYFRVNTHDRTVTDFLRNLSYGERKSVDIEVLKEELGIHVPAFIQGMIDGDGYVTDSNRKKNKLQNYVEIVSNDYSIAEWILSILNHCHPKIYSQDRKTCKLWTVRVYANNIRRFYNKVYKYKPNFISRKHQRVLNILNSLYE